MPKFQHALPKNVNVSQGLLKEGQTSCSRKTQRGSLRTSLSSYNLLTQLPSTLMGESRPRKYQPANSEFVCFCGLVTPQTCQTHLIMKCRQVTSSDAVIRQTFHRRNPSKHIFMVQLHHLVISFQHHDLSCRLSPVLPSILKAHCFTGHRRHMWHAQISSACRGYRSDPGCQREHKRRVSMFSSKYAFQAKALQDQGHWLCSSYVF